MAVGRFDENLPPDTFNGSMGHLVSTVHDYWTDITYNIDKLDLSCQIQLAPSYSKYGIKMPSPKDYFNLKGLWSYNGKVSSE